jgi:hypothetical protein
VYPAGGIVLGLLPRSYQRFGGEQPPQALARCRIVHAMPDAAESKVLLPGGLGATRSRITCIQRCGGRWRLAAALPFQNQLRNMKHLSDSSTTVLLSERQACQSCAGGRGLRAARHKDIESAGFALDPGARAKPYCLVGCQGKSRRAACFLLFPFADA